MEELIVALVLWAIPVLLAITLHEAAHGYVARLCGDYTAERAGRISLNPLRHIDPIGTVLVPGAILLMNIVTNVSFPPFGWARAVPVNFAALRNPRRDMVWVAAAGPGSNLLQALAWAIIARFALSVDSDLLFQLGQAGILVNLALMLLNLLPLPPLDGGRIAIGLLPLPAARLFARLEPYGFPILIALLYFRVLDYLLWPLIPLFKGLLTLLTGA